MAASLTDLERKALVGLRRRLEAAFGPRLLDLRLFGSRARGDAEADSDYDVLVLLEAERIRYREQYAVAEAADAILDTFGLHISPLVMDRPRWEKLRERERRIVRDVETEGLAL